MNINEFYEGLDELFGNTNHEEIEEYLVRSLAQAKGAGDLSLEIAVRNELGGFYRASGRVESAVENYDMVLKTFENMGMTNTENYATTLINAGDVYIIIGDYDRALNMFLSAKEILIALGFEKDYRMAALSNNISAVYRMLSDFNNAEKSLMTAFEIISGIPEAKSELAVTYVNLAQLQIKQGKTTEAKENLGMAVNIFENDFQGRDVHYSQAMAAFGEAYYYEGNYKDSIACYEKAMELVKRDFGENINYNKLKDTVEHIKKLEVAR